MGMERRQLAGWVSEGVVEGEEEAEEGADGEEEVGVRGC